MTDIEAYLQSSLWFTNSQLQDAIIARIIAFSCLFPESTRKTHSTGAR